MTRKKCRTSEELKCSSSEAILRCTLTFLKEYSKTFNWVWHQRSGAGEKDVAILESFSELKNDSKYEIPAFIMDNIALMKYDKPTPIQKHSIPLGIAGFDLMCCAQTVSSVPSTSDSLTYDHLQITTKLLPLSTLATH